LRAASLLSTGLLNTTSRPTSEEIQSKDLSQVHTTTMTWLARWWRLNLSLS
jgi:hypothetical protein